MKLPPIASIVSIKDAKTEPPDPLKLENRRQCPCWQMVIDAEAREVRCGKCDALMDPIKALVKIRDHWGRYRGSWGAAKNMCEDKRKELEDLKRQVRNEKAKLRRWQAKTSSEPRDRGSSFAPPRRTSDTTPNRSSSPS